MVLDSTFRDPQSIARLKTNWPISRLISAECTADKNLSFVTMPTLVVHSRNDLAVPYVSGKELFDLIPAKAKWFWPLDEIGHGNVFFIQSGKYRKDFLQLLR